MNRISKKPFRNVFLCYCRHDSQAVRSLYARLKRAGIYAWLDLENLQPGQNWQGEIRKAILQSDVIIVCLSREFNKQPGYRHEELKIALEKAKLFDDTISIIPVRLEECGMPESLSHLHRLDLFEPNGFRRLLRALKRLEDTGQK